MIRYGNLIDLSGLQFEENGTQTKWIQAVPLGKYTHPVHGLIDITPERVARFADNVNNKVRGQDLDIDFDHKRYNGKAAGWVRKAEAKPDGLWILVEWVKEAWNDIKSGAYRYFSPEFVDEWTHPASNVKFNDVLFGGGITNRPFLKGILPLSLSETAESDTIGGNPMFTDEQRAALRAKLGLGEDADDSAILAALLTAFDQMQTPDPQTEQAEETVEASSVVDNNDGTAQQPETGSGTVPSSVTVKFSEDEIAKLSETPEIKKLFEQFQQNSIQLKEMRDTSTVNAIVKKFEEKGYALPATVLNGLTETIKLSENDRFTGSVIQMMSKLAETGLVQLGESEGHNPIRHVGGGKVDATKQLSEMANKLAKEKGMEFGDAMVQIVLDNPELYEGHRDESYIN